MRPSLVPSGAPAIMVTIVHISDLHCGERGGGVAPQAAAAINRLRPDCIVVTGDLTHNGSRRDYRLARAFLETLNAPVVGCCGNHDAPVFSPLARIWSPHARFDRLALLASWDSSDRRVGVRAFKSARALQARPYWSQGVYRPTEIAALVASFAPDAAHRLIVCHHPPHAPPGLPMRIHTLRARESISAVRGRLLMLCGHVHAARCYTAFGRDNLIVSTAPTLGSARLREEAAGQSRPGRGRSVRWSSPPTRP